MLVLKKLTFAPLFLVIFIALVYQLSPLLKSYDFIFSLSLNTFTSLVAISALIVGASFAFILFAGLALETKLVLPTAILASLTFFLFVDPTLSIVLTIGSLLSMILSFIALDNTLKSYITFNALSLLGPQIRHLINLFILIFCIGFFLSMSQVITEKGFQIPDTLLDTALKFSQNNIDQNSSPQLPSLSKEQIDLLKKNPDLLKQSGFDPSILDSLNQPQTNSQDLAGSVIKKTIKDQVDNILKPYLAFIPAVLAVILFLTLQGLTSFLTLLIYPLLWIIFYILEKSGFIKYVVEQRPVKKLVI